MGRTSDVTNDVGGLLFVEMRPHPSRQARRFEGGISQVVFPLPNPVATLVNCRFDDVYMYDISIFCSDMILSSNDWWQASKDNSTVMDNAKHVLKVHPTGWGNAISGIPVLA